MISFRPNLSGGSPFEITSDGAGVIGFNGGYGGHLHFLEPVFEKK
jgi:hypothetical protein